MIKFLLGFGIPVILGLLIIFLVSQSSSKKKKTETKDSVDHEEKHSDEHHNHGKVSKSESKFFPKFFGTIGVILALAVVVVLVFWVITVIKKQNTPKSKQVQYSVEVRRKSIHLTPEFNNIDSIHIQYGQYTVFKFASVPFCAKNGAGYVICGEAFSDPDFPKGVETQDQWFRAQNNYNGNIVVVVYERRWKEVYN